MSTIDNEKKTGDIKPKFDLESLKDLMECLREHKDENGEIVFGEEGGFNHLYSNCCNTCGGEGYYPKGEKLETAIAFVTKIFDGGMNDSLDEDGNGEDEEILVAHQNFTKESFELIRSTLESGGGVLEGPEFSESRCMVLHKGYMKKD